MGFKNLQGGLKRSFAVMKYGRFLVAISLGLWAFSSMGLSSAEAATAAHEFTGAKKCSLCHKSPEQGAQYKIWLESTHAKAFQILGSDRAKSLGASLGVSDPQTSPKCLKCHSTAYYFTEKIVSQKITVEEGVSCESCHGPGADYAKKDTMKKRQLAVEKGLLIPDEKTCRQCHGAGGPVAENFDFKKSWDKIKHPRPKK